MKKYFAFSRTNRLKAFFGMVVILFAGLSVHSAEIVEVTPLTDRIIMVHFNEGDVTYPNDLNVVRLNIAQATTLIGYTVTSGNDSDFSTTVNPVDLGRKSKGTAFVSGSGVPWGGSSSNPTSKPWSSEHWIYLHLDKPMKSGNSYTLNTGNLASNGSEWIIDFDEKLHISEAVHVNTLGYAPERPKYGYVYHWMGDKGNLDLSGYGGKKFWIMKDGEAEPAYEGVLSFRTGATHAETGQTLDTPNRNFLGAEVYQCDFSSVTQPGNYRLAVEGIGASFPFVIGADAILMRIIMVHALCITSVVAFACIPLIRKRVMLGQLTKTPKLPVTMGPILQDNCYIVPFPMLSGHRAREVVRRQKPSGLHPLAIPLMWQDGTTMPATGTDIFPTSEFLLF
jgi:hypothetical protein